MLKNLAFRMKSEDPINIRPEAYALDMEFNDIIRLLRQMDKYALELLAINILHTNDVILRGLALNLFPRIGTLASTRLVVDLASSSLSRTESEKILQDLPFHLRHHSEQLIEECKVGNMFYIIM
jgi:hypothetical protein